MKQSLLFIFFYFLSVGFLNAAPQFEEFDSKGKQFYRENKLDSALIMFEEALVAAENEESLFKIAKSQNNLGSTYLVLGNLIESQVYLKLAVNSYEELGVDSLTGDAYHNIALVYKKRGLYTEALEFYTKALKIFESLDDIAKLGRVYDALGNIENREGNYEQAIYYHKQAIKKRLIIGDKYELSKSYLNLGQVLNNIGEYVKAREYLIKAKELKLKLGKSTDSVYSQLGLSYLKENKLDSASIYLNLSLLERKQKTNQSKLSVTYRYFSDIWAQKDDMEKSAAYLDSALTISILFKNDEAKSEILERQIQLFEQYEIGNNIYEKYQLLFALKDSIAKNKIQNDLALVKSEYSLIQKNQELKLKNERIKFQELKTEKLNLKVVFLVIVIVVIILFLAIVIIISLKLRRSKARMKIQNDELERNNSEIDFLHKELAHRTKNYFQMFSGLLKYDKSQTENVVVKKILDNYIGRVDAMSQMQKYLLFSDEQSSTVSLNLYINDILENISVILNHQDKPVTIIRELEKVSLDYDTAIRMGLVMNEMISNSYEHALGKVEDPKIHVKLMKIPNGKIRLVLADNGKGFNWSDKEFEKSRGIGLMKMILIAVKGELSYSTSNLKGTTVYIEVLK